MSTASLWDRLEDPLKFIGMLGETFAKSTMFGCQNEEQGRVFALHCALTGQSPLEVMQTYHLIDGKLSKRFEAMLAEFNEAGGTHQWIKDGSDGKEASCRFIMGVNDVTVTYTIDDAERAGLVKPKSGWVKNPANMLRARVASNGVTMVYPKARVGVYTPEEIEDIASDAGTVPQPQPGDSGTPGSSRSRGRPAKAAVAGVSETGTATAPANETASPATSQATTTAPVEQQLATQTAPVSAATAQAAAPATTPPAATPASAAASPQSDLLTDDDLTVAKSLREKLSLPDNIWQTLLEKIGVPADPATNTRKLSKGTRAQCLKACDWMQRELSKKLERERTAELDQWANTGVAPKQTAS